MRGKVDGTRKIETAKTTLAKLIGDLPPDTKVGLMAYGHREKKSCKDVEVLLPVGHATPSTVSAQLDRIKAKGKTPIAYALEQSANAFVGLEKGPNNVVLISDGKETCDGDPCAVAGKIAKSNINVRVHVVGFDIPKKDREQLECIAKLGKGKYFTADTTRGFAAAVTKVVKVVQKPLPESPKVPAWEVVFQDKFDRSELGENWQAVNPNPDAFVVENGEMLLLANSKAAPSDSKFPNLMRLTKELPTGDWRLTATINIELQRGVERFYVGLYDSKDRWLATVLDAWHGHGSSSPYLNAVAQKFTGGKLTEGAKNLMGPHNGWRGWSKLAKYLATVPVTVRIEKQGRQYIGSVKVDAPEDALKKFAYGDATKWLVLNKLTMLRAPKSIFVGYAFHEKDSGESLVHIKEIKLEVPGSL